MIGKLLPPLLLALFLHAEILSSSGSSGKEMPVEKSAGIELSDNERTAKDGKFKYFAPLTKSEKRSIDFVMTTISKESISSLLSEEKRLDKAEAKLKKVSSLRFWKEVLTNDSLKSGLRSTTSLAKKMFIDKTVKNWENAYRAGELDREHFIDFSEATGLPLREIDRYARQQNWKGLIEYLFEQKENDEM